MSPMRLFFSVLFLAVLLGVFAPRRADALPVFARRYGTSCQTCHVVFPRLTPFGEAFRRNGYRFPDGTDEDYRRQEPLALGASAYRDVFPNSVWPGDMPAAAPIAVFMSSTAAYNTADSGRSAFSSLAGTVRLTAAANFGERFSAWAGVNFSAATGTETATAALERAFLVVNPFRRPSLALRVGRIDPGVLGFSSHRLPGPMPWIVSTPVRDNQFTLEPSQLGIEATGVLAWGRGSYTVGYVHGVGNGPSAPQDFYGRLGFKLGGLRLDGITPSGDTSVSSPQPWREWAVHIGGFAYRGAASLGNATVASQGDRFVVAGGDVNATLGNLLVILAYSYGSNTSPALINPELTVSSHHMMAQLDYVLFPWLIPGVRIERNYVSGTSRTRAIAQVYALVRANIRTSVTAIFEQPVAGPFAFTALQGTLSLGF